MQRKGVCYDVGREMLGRNWRPDYDPTVVRRELEIIRDDLHCNAVRLQGKDLGRLQTAADNALNLGLEVWYSPELWDHDADETLAYLRAAAKTAHQLEQRWPGRVLFSVGSELTFFMQGFVPGANVLKRLASPALGEIIRSGLHNAALNRFLGRASEVVRAEFQGAITYASLPFEAVDWTPFDWVGGDFYREARGRDRYAEMLQRFRAFGKPLANMEFGCCTFRGAEDLGGRGWQIVDYGRWTPRLTGDYAYDQGAQAREVAELLRINDSAGVDATFVFTFVQPPQEASAWQHRRLARARFDPDIVSYSLVKWLPDGRHGTVYPEMTWEPKESFGAVAEYYGRIELRPYSTAPRAPRGSQGDRVLRKQLPSERAPHPNSSRGTRR
jgi:hypothetical protein